MTRLEERGETRIFAARLSADWAIWGPNGGYLAALALRAGGACAAIPRPVSFYCHFLSVARFEPVELRVKPLRLGRRSEAWEVSMWQDERPVLHAMLRTAAEAPGLEHDVAQMPAVPAPDELLTWSELFPDEPSTYAFWNNLEAKPTDGKLLPKADAEQQALPPTLGQWNRFRPRACFDDPFVDAGRSVILVDTMFWPAAARAHPQPAFQAPSLDLSVWFHRPAHTHEWLLSDHSAPIGAAGVIGGTGRVWSVDGRLIASGGAQLLCIPAVYP